MLSINVFMHMQQDHEPFWKMKQNVFTHPLPIGSSSSTEGTYGFRANEPISVPNKNTQSSEIVAKVPLEISHDPAETVTHDPAETVTFHCCRTGRSYGIHPQERY